jgi:hypothetical protein
MKATEESNKTALDIIVVIAMAIVYGSFRFE